MRRIADKDEHCDIEIPGVLNYLTCLFDLKI